MKRSIQVERRSRRIHPRVQRVLAYLQEQELDRHHTSLMWLALIAKLSPSRLMHVFTESLGIPLRPYLLRLRVQRAAGALAAGHSVTEAAHVAGFADGPHLTRTFRRILGATPRDLLRLVPDAQELRVLVTTTCALSETLGSPGTILHPNQDTTPGECRVTSCRN
jgi:AraC-like DNA-binding protein